MFFRSVLRAAGALCLLATASAIAIPIPLPPAEVDITGVWSAEGSATFQDIGKGDIVCTYQGSIEFLQTGNSLSGQAIIGLVTGDASCPSLTGPVSGTVSANRADFLIGGAVKGTGVEFCGDVLGEVMTGDWLSPPPLPCFVLKEQKGGQFIGTFSSERIPPGVPALTVPGLALLVTLLGLVGLSHKRRRDG